MAIIVPPDFDADDYAAALTASNAEARPLSLHLRLPLCRDADGQCNDHRGMDPFEVDLARLDREMVLVRRCLSPGRRLEALHWGSCLPPSLSLSRMSGLVDRLATRFPFDAGARRDFTIELDPRATDLLTLRHLEALGFNRLTLIVRVPPPDRVDTLTRLQARIEPLLDETARLGWHSLDLALIVPSPPCPRETDAALATLIAMTPPRITLRYDPCGTGGEAAPPDGAHRDPLVQAETRLTEAGYRPLGQGSYARRGASLEDALAQARRERRRDRLGLGAGAISRLPDAEARNTAHPGDYAAALDAGRLATASGRWLRGKHAKAGPR